MRIVNREQFFGLPPGTLFFQCREKWAFEDIHVKFDSLYGDGRSWGGVVLSEKGTPIDFVSMPLSNFEAHDSGEWGVRLEEMADEGASYPLCLDSAGRDGMFDEKAMFMVYEREDVVKLRDFLTSIIDGEQHGND